MNNTQALVVGCVILFLSLWAIKAFLFSGIMCLWHRWSRLMILGCDCSAKKSMVSEALASLVNQNTIQLKMIARQRR